MRVRVYMIISCNNNNNSHNVNVIRQNVLFNQLLKQIDFVNNYYRHKMRLFSAHVRVLLLMFGDKLSLFHFKLKI